MRCGAVLLLLAARMGVAAGCVVGDLGQPPSLEISSHPPDCCYGEWAGTIAGAAANIDTAMTVVALYAQTDRYYIQPDGGARTEIGCDGGYSAPARGGHHYAAVLARRGWTPPDAMDELPEVGDSILAVAREPERRIEFSGRSWIVRSSGSLRLDPGPNYWSDSPEQVWVDAEGSLHLRAARAGDRWLCSEVAAAEPLGYGGYAFVTTAGAARIDPNAVLGMFVYQEPGQEIDIELSRWGDPAVDNAQFVVQPWEIEGNRYRFALDPAEDLVTHRFIWTADTVAFAAWNGVEPDPPDGSPGLIAAWRYAGPGTPVADREVPHINLWLLDDEPPADGEPIEVVVREFRHEQAGQVSTRRGTWGRIRVAFR